MVALSKTQAAGQAARLTQVRPELVAAYGVALGRWLGDRQLLALGRPIVTEGYRPSALQAAYYAQGRAGLAEQNRLRGLAGLSLFAVGSAEAGRLVTDRRAGTSNHNHLPSWALDVALLQADGSVKWDSEALRLFSHLMKAADARVVWGGDWDGDGDTSDQRLHDWPHFELTG